MGWGVLFDLDGTLLDTLRDLTDSTNYALRQFGYPERTAEQIRQAVGNGAARQIARSVPQGADPEPVLAVYRQYYQTHCQIATAPYPGVVEALAQLREAFPVAIVSNKPDSAVKALCAEHFPGIYGLGERADCPRKPAPDMICQAMAAIGVGRCVYVGDSEVDVLTARNAGEPCLSVLWGFRDRQTLLEAGAEHFCQRPQELVSQISGMVRKISL